MGFFDWFRGPQVTSTFPEPYELALPLLNSAYQDILATPADDLWRTQPHLRTVITFLARHMAQIGLHLLRHEPDGGRERVREGDMAELLRQPSPDSTWYELMFDLVASLALYDQAVLWRNDSSVTRPHSAELRLIKNSWILDWERPTPFSLGDLTVIFPGDHFPTTIRAEHLLVFHGWDPTDSSAGTSPVDSLREILAEQWHARMYRLEMWRRGGRVGSYITRPPDVQWTPDARNKFVESFRRQYTGTGPDAGGVPILEDGMEMRRIGFTAREEEYVEGTKLSLTEVASVYHVNPTMLGILDNANYSNVREFRRMLYGDTLGPIIKQIEERFNAFLLPMMNEPREHYVEFNLQEKLRGSFEEQAKVMHTAVGSPWLTVNEARARENLPSIEGGDALVRPLNVSTTEEEPLEPEELDDPDDPDETDDNLSNEEEDN